jgi:transcriptional regulator of acetoin/glycerol metabolism
LQIEAGNVSRMAEKIGLERTHLHRKLKQLGIKISKKYDENEQ